ncbi:DoxX family protein [Georgenia thermotolerans]|nr:DoxX family membrane protein [Georgenia thermotolerans]
MAKGPPATIVKAALVKRALHRGGRGRADLAAMAKAAVLAELARAAASRGATQAPPTAEATPAVLRDAGLFVLRAGVGSVLLAHGSQKLFGWFGGGGVQGTGAAFEQMGFTPGGPSAVAAGLGEAGGGALMLLGLATPVAGAAAAGTMMAASAVHFPAFFAQEGGYEYAALLGVSTAALALTGPGGWSLDALLGYRLNKPWLSVVGLVASAVAATAVLQRRAQHLAATAPGAPPVEGEPEG